MDDGGAHPYSGFCWRLFERVTAAYPAQNLMISPFSIVSALAVVHAGSGGNSAAQIAQALGVVGLDPKQLDALHERLRLKFEPLPRSADDLPEDVNPDDRFDSIIDQIAEEFPFEDALKAYPAEAYLSSAASPHPIRTDDVFLMANALWMSVGFSLHPTFQRRVERVFDAEINCVNFLDPGVPARINAWVKDKTQGAIEAVVESLSPNTEMMLVNCVYMDAKWQHPFEDDGERNFSRSDGTTKPVGMMQVKFKTFYRGTHQFQAVVLPYRSVGLSMILFLPHRRVRFAEFVQQMPAYWQDWSAASGGTELECKVIMPRFTYPFEVNLNAALQALNITDIFVRGRADFSRLSFGDSLPYIGEIRHKTFIEVDELGTRASGVTVADWLSFALEEPPIDFTVDRSFAYVIYHEGTGLPLFMGTVDDPTM